MEDALVDGAQDPTHMDGQVRAADCTQDIVEQIVHDTVLLPCVRIACRFRRVAREQQLFFLEDMARVLE